jgi:CMP/dCMP kinase
MLIAIAGGPGTGTTTLSKLLAARLGAQHVYAGQIFRNLAAEHGMDLVAFNRFAQTHPEVDEELDRRMIETARGGSVVLDARLSAWHAREAGVPVLRVLLTVPPDVAARRVANRDGGDVQTALRTNADREASELKRYRELYHFDPTDRANYDLVIDSSRFAPDQIADQVEAALERMRVEAGPSGAR